jgi:hypothetical protein
MRLGYSLSALILAVAAGTASAQFKDFYVSIDGRPDQTGTYAAFANPNAGRLTVTWAHAFPTGYDTITPASSNHYHRIGALAHTGPAASPSTLFTNRNVPEWNGVTPAAQTRFLRVAPGSGAFAGKLVVVDHPDNTVADHSYYDNLTFASVHQQEPTALADPLVAGATRLSNGTFQWTGASLPAATRASTNFGWMYTSSAYLSAPNTWSSRYTQYFDDAQVALQLVSRDSKLGIATTAGTSILTNPGDTQLLGSGRSWEFTPVFNIDAATAINNEILTATFRLVDLRTSAPLQSSGDFTFWVQVPEPTTVATLLAGSVVALRRRR